MVTTNFLIFIFFTLYLCFSAGGNAEFKEVQIVQGRVKGYKSKYGNFFEFFGIPYATAPTGPNKFKVSLIIYVLFFLFLYLPLHYWKLAVSFLCVSVVRYILK